MKKISITLLLIFLSSYLLSKESSSFHELDMLIKSKDGWVLNRKENAIAFHKARHRLKSNFIPAVMKYLGTDIDKHYNIAMFLSDPYYLDHEQPMNPLALLIYQQGIVLISQKTGIYDRCEILTFSVNAALLAKRLHLKALASNYKKTAQKFGKMDECGGSFPALTEEGYKIYNEL
jgi:hypothetical protein